MEETKATGESKETNTKEDANIQNYYNFQVIK